VWAALIDVNQARFRGHAKPIFGYQNWCHEIAGVTVGELSVTAIRSVVRRYSDACFVTAARKRAGEHARYPRRKKGLVPLRWSSGTFSIEHQRVRLSVAQGAPECWVRLGRPIPYPIESLRSVTLLVDAGRLVLDVTAGLDVKDHDLDSGRVAGVDLGIIHPIAASTAEQGLLVSGRALRAEERLHLADTKARARRMAPKAPRRGQRGSKRWRQLRAKQRRAEAASRRRVRQSHHEAAKHLIEWAVAQRVGTLAVGDPHGITNKDVGRVHNRRLRTWRRTHLMNAICDESRPRRHHRPARGRTRHLQHLSQPRMPIPGPQTLRPELLLSPLWISRASRSCRCPQHRRQQRRNPHQHPRAGRAPSRRNPDPAT
jgi:Probable transposase